LPSTPSSGFPSSFTTLFVIFIVIFVIAFVAAIGTAIWKSTVLRRGGLSPVVSKEQLEVKLAQSQLLQPPSAQSSRQKPSKEQRLAEVDDLYRRGIITAEEHAAGRGKIISGE
jgi:hypothetical protein